MNELQRVSQELVYVPEILMSVHSTSLVCFEVARVSGRCEREVRAELTSLRFTSFRRIAIILRRVSQAQIIKSTPESTRPARYKLSTFTASLVRFSHLPGR
jgi:hypothetical protein